MISHRNSPHKEENGEYIYSKSVTNNTFTAFEKQVWTAPSEFSNTVETTFSFRWRLFVYLNIYWKCKYL